MAGGAYDQLVQSQSDLIGAIAYALYKQDKREFINSQGLTSDDVQVRNYHMSALGTKRCEALRQQASILLSQYTTGAVEEAEKRAQEQFTDSVDHLKAIIKRRTSFWTSVFASLVATMLFGLLLSVAVWMNKNEQNPFGVIYKLWEDAAKSAPLTQK